tara:strand:- start:277 stop:624 length:348 start_codon:yes stop_codon:yes gene_type:complete
MTENREDLIKIIKSFDKLLDQLNRSTKFHYKVWKDNEICKLQNEAMETILPKRETVKRILELYSEYAQKQNNPDEKNPDENNPADLWNLGMWEAYINVTDSLFDLREELLILKED